MLKWWKTIELYVLPCKSLHTLLDTAQTSQLTGSDDENKLYKPIDTGIVLSSGNKKFFLSFCLYVLPFDIRLSCNLVYSKSQMSWFYTVKGMSHHKSMEKVELE